MTDAELKVKLDELLNLPAETECVEFKEAKSKFDSDDLGKYLSTNGYIIPIKLVTSSGDFRDCRDDVG
jgi:hypothetical protein